MEENNLYDHEDDVSDVSWFDGPDGGQILATSSVDATVRLWRIGFGEKSPTPAGRIVVPAPVSSVAWAGGASGELLLGTASADAKLRVWKIQHGQHELQRTLEGHTQAILTCSFTPHNDCLVSGSADGTVRLWQSTGGGSAEIMRCDGHTSWVSKVVCAQDKIVSASRDCTLRLWDVSRGSSKGEQMLELWGHSGTVTCCAFAGSGLVLSSGHDKTVRLWDIGSGMEISRLSAHTAPVSSVSVSRDASFFVSTSWDGTCLVWSMRQRRVIHQIALTHSHASNSTAGLRPVRGLSTSINRSTGEIAIGMSGGGVKLVHSELPWEDAYGQTQGLKHGARRDTRREQQQQQQQQQAAGAEEWLVEALYQHLQCTDSTTRIQQWLDQRCHLFAAQSGINSGDASMHQVIHEEYRDMMLVLIDKLRYELGAQACHVAAAVTALSQRQTDTNVTRIVRLLDAMEDYSLFAAVCEGMNAAASQERNLKHMEGQKDQEMRDALRRFEKEAEDRERERIQQEETKLAELQARLALVMAREAENSSAMEAMKRDKEELVRALEIKTLESQVRREAAADISAIKQDTPATLQMALDVANEHAHAVEQLRQEAKLERERRDMHEAGTHQQLMELQQRQAALEAEKGRADSAGQMEVMQLRAMMEQRVREEDERRERHEKEFRAKLEQAEASRDALDSERANALQELRNVTLQLEQKRVAEAELRRNVEEQAKQLEKQHAEALRLKEALEKELQAVRSEEQYRRAEQVKALEDKLNVKEIEVQGLEKERSRINKERDRDLKIKEATIDQMLSEKRRNHEQIEALRKENQQAKEERQRLQQTVAKMEDDYKKRVMAEEERARQAKMRLEMLDALVIDNKQQQLATLPHEDKDKILADFEKKKQDLEKMQLLERQRQERVLQERMEERDRRRRAKTPVAWTVQESE